ncbi:MAG: hypothetical protein RL112_2755 [Planctomycetota bacterium]
MPPVRRVLFAVVLLGGGALASSGGPDYGREVRPLLADRCFACHGPDEAQRKAGLRLDREDGARAELKSGARAIVPGSRGESELARRILLDADDEEAMPPAEFKHPLSSAERDLLLSWIDAGARYEPHWAFVAPRRPDAPVVADATWARDPLDALVLAGLEARGLAPEPQADPTTLLRRASLALTGLPPTPEEALAFAADPSDAAYEARIDALLDSPRAAEHMATSWLDLARYADTHGYQTDNPSFAWPWRDWLLQSLRSNQPYDQFVVDVLAGDLKPGATIADRVATGFQRLHRLTEEGGSIAEEFRQEGIADRVGTFGTAFLGLTLDCARCHDHKHDPVSTREFHGLAAMFGRIDENGLKPYSLPGDAPPPYVRLQTPEQEARTRELEAAEVARREEWSTLRAAALARFSLGGPNAASAPAPDDAYSFESLADDVTPNAVSGRKPASIDRRRPEQLGAVRLVDGARGQAMAFDGDGGLWLDGVSGIGRHDAVSLAAWIRLGERNARAALVQASGFYTQDADASGIELEVEDGRLRWSAIHYWPGSAASIRTLDTLPVGRWVHVVATYDGSSRAAGLRLQLDGQPAGIEVVRDALDGPLAGHALEVGSRSRGVGFRSGAMDELRVWRSELTRWQARLVARADGLALEDDDEALRAEHAAERAADVVAARDAWRDAQRALAAHLDPVPRFACMADSPWARPTHVLRRGAYDQPDLSQAVEPGALDAVLPFDPALPRNRMGLARWLLDPRHPLTARVQVNRLWTQVFGVGLVETAENFGLQGAMPAQEALLDLLAHDYAHGDGAPGSAWNTRRMLKRLATSSTFRQRSSCAPSKREADPRNVALSRGPTMRLSAEMLRDQALFAGGILHEVFGGPSARPWEPEGLWHEAGQVGNYVPDIGPNSRRRGVYTFRKRTVPPPNMAAFDAGAREACVARRGSTNTPLQALVAWNDRVHLEAARATAKRAQAEAVGIEARVARLHALVCTRAPSPEEQAALVQLVAEATRRYAAAPEDARKLCGSEDAELAALTLACGAVHASDGALMSR